MYNAPMNIIPNFILTVIIGTLIGALFGAPHAGFILSVKLGIVEAVVLFILGAKARASKQQCPPVKSPWQVQLPKSSDGHGLSTAAQPLKSPVGSFAQTAGQRKQKLLEEMKQEMFGPEQ